MSFEWQLFVETFFAGSTSSSAFAFRLLPLAAAAFAFASPADWKKPKHELLFSPFQKARLEAKPFGRFLHGPSALAAVARAAGAHPHRGCHLRPAGPRCPEQQQLHHGAGAWSPQCHMYMLPVLYLCYSATA